VRGIERRNIFFDDMDRDNFLTRLSVILSGTQTRCFAWAMIPNHVHLLLRTGTAPIATVMRRLLRARLVEDLNQLVKYPYSGHSALMGNTDRPWQNADYVIRLFGETRSKAIRCYREFVTQGIAAGSQPDLTGSGRVRSAGGWLAVKMLRKEAMRMKADERILGNGSFVERVLKNADEIVARKCVIKSSNYDFNWLIDQVAKSLNMRIDDVIAAGRYKNVVKARSVLCYWGIRELGMSTVEMAKRLQVSQATISQSAMRGRQIAMKNGLRLDLTS
jgi:REP element-mobilizing transposase RayT